MIISVRLRAPDAVRYEVLLRRTGAVTDAAFDTVRSLVCEAASAMQKQRLRKLHHARDTMSSSIGGHAAMAENYYVYILANRPRGVLYVGVTNNIARRIGEHRAKLVPGFTEKHGIVMLVHIEAYVSILEARAREYSLKRWRRAWKFELIEADNPEWRDRGDELLF